ANQAQRDHRETQRSAHDLASGRRGGERDARERERAEGDEPHAEDRAREVDRVSGPVRRGRRHQSGSAAGTAGAFPRARSFSSSSSISSSSPAALRMRSCCVVQSIARERSTGSALRRRYTTYPTKPRTSHEGPAMRPIGWVSIVNTRIEKIPAKPTRATIGKPAVSPFTRTGTLSGMRNLRGLSGSRSRSAISATKTNE